MNESLYIAIWCAAFGAVPLLLGIIFATIAGRYKKNHQKRRSEWKETTATVLGFRPMGTVNSLTNPDYYSTDIGLFSIANHDMTKLTIVEFPLNGQIIRTKASPGYTQKPHFWVGDTLEILYNPNDLSKVFLKDNPLWNKVIRIFRLVGGILFSITAICLITAVIFYLKYKGIL